MPMLLKPGSSAGGAVFWLPSPEAMTTAEAGRAESNSTRQMARYRIRSRLPWRTVSAARDEIRQETPVSCAAKAAAIEVRDPRSVEVEVLNSDRRRGSHATAHTLSACNPGEPGEPLVLTGPPRSLFR